MCFLLGIATPSTSIQVLLQYKGQVLRGSRTADPSITGLIPQKRWKWIRIHNIYFPRYMGKGGDIR